MLPSQVIRPPACPACPACLLACLQREANIVYLGRDKAKGVPHHAKAGNINSCLLKEGAGKVRSAAAAAAAAAAIGRPCLLVFQSLAPAPMLVQCCCARLHGRGWPNSAAPCVILYCAELSPCCACCAVLQGEYIMVLDCDMIVHPGEPTRACPTLGPCPLSYGCWIV